MIEVNLVTKKARRGSGFTLLELIAVMGIIVALSLVVVSGYASIMRTMSEMAGVNALRKAAMLSRQHACIDGRDTYFFITGFDTYVLCRKAGTISERNTQSRSGDEKPTYLPTGQYEALWLFDKYSDLGASKESFSGMGVTGEMDATQLAEFEKSYTGTLLFDLTEGKTAFIKYPPWFDHLTDTWIMGLPKDTPSGFKAGSNYGWTVYPEQKLPKGYAFVSGKDSFIEEGSFYFKPDGTAHSDDNLLDISVQELGTKKISTIKIHDSGKIETEQY